MTAVTLTCTAPGRHAEPTVLAVCGLGGTSPVVVAATLSQVLGEAGLGRCTATIVLADEWTRLFMVTPPTNTERMRDCHAAVALRFQLLYGETPRGWSVQADWDAGHPFLACALPQTLCEAILHSCAEHAVSVVSMVPQFIGAWNRWHRHLGAATWFGIVHAGSLMLAAIEGGRLAEIRRLTVPQQALHRHAWLSDQVSREALRLGLHMPSSLRLCGDVPDAWLADGNGSGIDCRRLDPPLAANETTGVGASAALADNEV